jgi:MBOAT, membrane-bound O-acyltransferase family
MERTGDLWDSGAVDVTGSLMVLVLKEVALCHNLSDSFARDSSKGYSPERAAFKVARAPNPIHYFSYIFATGNLLAGPFFEYREYMDFMARTGDWRRACEGRLLGAAATAAVRCFGVASAGVAASQLIAAKFSPHMLIAPGVYARSIPERIAIAFLTGALRAGMT